jgi:small subunit ribosomal protein S5e
VQVRIVKHAFEIIQLLTDQNPIQILVDAIINRWALCSSSAGVEVICKSSSDQLSACLLFCSGPREDATRIGSAGVVRRQAVDISPLRRVNQVGVSHAHW